VALERKDKTKTIYGSTNMKTAKEEKGSMKLWIFYLVLK